MSSDYNNPDFDFPGFNLKRGGNALVSQIQLKGSTSGLLTIKSPAVTGTNSVILSAGITTNDNAPAGQIGEIIESNIPIGSAVALTTGVAINVTSISLTAGDWDVRRSLRNS